jgi:primosomal protein N' (replication factor Y)
MTHFVEVLLPIPLERNFTYSVTPQQAALLGSGMRVAVPFGKSKLYTGLVLSLHNKPPAAYEAKEVFQILDEAPLVTELQVKHWKWMASYYMCTLGEVFRAAVPGVFLLESETRVLPEPGFEQMAADLTDVESIILEALQNQPELKVGQIGELIDRKGVLPILARMFQKKAIRLREALEEDYHPKMARFLRIHPQYQDENALEELLADLSRAPKQTQVLLHLFQLQQGRQKPVRGPELEQRAGTSRSVIRALLDKGILQEYDAYGGDTHKQAHASLNQEQNEALEGIRTFFGLGKTVLLHGVTASGKTEVYSHLIEECTRGGKTGLPHPVKQRYTAISLRNVPGGENRFYTWFPKLRSPPSSFNGYAPSSEPGLLPSIPDKTSMNGGKYGIMFRQGEKRRLLSWEPAPLFSFLSGTWG